ncbi:MAG: hypothetical protein JW841_03540 [Deltaproteobacteria bacterium]|nr:hypothetical protein [Deltaproteobacteria bacterium]
MRIGFFGQSGPFSTPILRYFLDYSAQFEIVLVVEGKKNQSHRMLQRLRKPRKGKIPDGNALSDIAHAAGFMVLETCDVNDPIAICTINDFNLDYIVCIGFDRLFSASVLGTAKQAINVHPSLLPQWRGPSPLFWISKSHERNYGVSIHEIDDKEDHGVIFCQTSFDPPAHAEGATLFTIAANTAAPLLVNVLMKLQQGRLKGIVQDDSCATRAPRPKPEDALINSTAWDCEHLVDFCCAAPYFRTPWLRFGEEIFFIRKGIETERGRKLPGHYALIGTKLMVQCRDGIACLEIQEPFQI